MTYKVQIQIVHIIVPQIEDTIEHDIEIWYMIQNMVSYFIITERFHKGENRV